MNTKHHASLLILFGTISSACVPEDEPSNPPTTQQTDQAITQVTTPVTQEPKSRTTGRFREVVTTPGCTGTIIGPYAVLTAEHCPDTGNIGWPSNNQFMSATKFLTSPYLQSNYYPSWYRTYNQQRINAGGADQSPIQHDLQLMFVPSLTPSRLATYLRDNNLHPQRVDPYAHSNRRYFVGQSDGNWREFARISSFMQATQNPWSMQSCLNQPGSWSTCVLDGVHRMSITFQTDFGDSGGPASGAWEYTRNGVTINGFRHVMGTLFGWNNLAPVAYNTGAPLTNNQRLTVRLNQLWLKSAASDADQDYLPYECDNNPISASNPQNLCIAPFGRTQTFNEPRALIQCKEGYGVTGIKGRQGWLIDQMAVRCTPVSCLGQRNSTCAANQSYWTDHFGGETNGGTAFETLCPNGQVITDVGARHTANSVVHEIRPYCRDYRTHVLDQQGTSWTSLGTIGNAQGQRSDGSNISAQQCPSRGYVKGFDLRSKTTGTNAMNYLSGIQTVCSGAVNRSLHTGDYGGDVHDLECPSQYVAVGVSARTNYNSALGVFALHCQRESEVAANIAPSQARVVTVHGSAYDNEGYYPAHRKSGATFFAEHAQMTTQFCAAGEALKGASFYLNQGHFKQLRLIKCERHDASLHTQLHWMSVGQASGVFVGSYCKDNESVSGMLVHTGWGTNGVSFHCKAQ